MSYKIGDKVRVVRTDEHKEIIDINVEMPIMGNSDPKYIYTLDNNKTYRSNEIVKLNRPSWEKRCECGANYTAFPDHHYDWCPMYKEMK